MKQHLCTGRSGGRDVQRTDRKLVIRGFGQGSRLSWVGSMAVWRAGLSRLSWRQVDRSLLGTLFPRCLPRSLIGLRKSLRGRPGCESAAVQNGQAPRGNFGRLDRPTTWAARGGRDCSRAGASFANRDRLGFLAKWTGTACIHISKAKNFIRPETPATMKRYRAGGVSGWEGDWRGRGCHEQWTNRGRV
jgi:hypothetical protein